MVRLNFAVKSWVGYQWYLFKRRRLYSRVTRIDGERGFCAIGDKRAVSHFSRYWLGSGPRLRIRPGITFQGGAKLMDRMVSRYGIVVASSDVAAKCSVGIELAWPRLVELTLPLASSWERFRSELSKSAVSDLQLVRRHNYERKVVSDESRVLAFHRSHYAPSMREMHGDDAYIFSQSSMLEIFRGTGEMIEVWRDNRWVASFIYKFEKKEVTLCALGWINGDRDERQHGVVSALYVFAIQRAYELGAVAINFGGVPPYLEDGLVFYKTKWGAQLAPEKMRDRVWRVVIDPEHEACRDFFRRYSLLVRSPEADRFDVLSERPRDQVPVAKKLGAGIREWMNLDRLKSRS